MAKPVTARAFIADIGNSCIKIACFSGSRPLFLERFYYAGNSANAAARAALLLAKKGAACVAMGSVNRRASQALVSQVKKKRIAIVRASKKNRGAIASRYCCAAIGMDRYANIIGVRHAYREKNLIVLDCGTALTVDIIEKNDHIGGFIVPGGQTLLDALYDRTDALPRVMVSQRQPIIGATTHEAIRSGCALQFQGGVREILSFIRTQRKKPFSVVVTGGGAHLVKNLGVSVRVDPYLTCRGIALLASPPRRSHVRECPP